MILTCPCCSKTYQIPLLSREVEGATFNCRKCRKLIIFKSGKPLDFHKFLHEQDSIWDAEGENTFSMDIEVADVE